MKKFTALLFITLAACSPGKIITTNLHDLASYEPGARVYSLPQTRIVVSAEAVKSDFVPGPFQQYAKEFLGIDNTQKQPYTRWELAHIKLFTSCEPDPEHYYSVQGDQLNSIDEILAQLTRSENIYNSSDSYNNYQAAFNSRVLPVNEFLFGDKSVKPYLYNTERKKQKNILADSAFVSFPGLEKQFLAKTEKEKAFEAAQFIFKIRKRRFKLIAGKYDISPDSVALALSVNELNYLEKKYLQLFTGVYLTDTIARIYSFVPAANEDMQRYTAFRFSNEAGFTGASENEGRPVIVEVKDLNKNEILNQIQIPHVNSTYQNLIFYRDPDKAIVSVFDDNHLVLESEIKVCQLGALVPYFIVPNKK
jgi:hypothetical protein